MNAVDIEKKRRFSYTTLCPLDATVWMFFFNYFIKDIVYGSSSMSVSWCGRYVLFVIIYGGSIRLTRVCWYNGCVLFAQVFRVDVMHLMKICNNLGIAMPRAVQASITVKISTAQQCRFRIMDFPGDFDWPNIFPNFHWYFSAFLFELKQKIEILRFPYCKMEMPSMHRNILHPFIELYIRVQKFAIMAVVIES